MPKEILKKLREEPKPGWVHWFFSFTHNLGISKKKQENIIRIRPRYKNLKNKIQDLKEKAPGLRFYYDFLSVFNAKINDYGSIDNTPIYK